MTAQPPTLRPPSSIARAAGAILLGALLVGCGAGSASPGSSPVPSPTATLPPTATPAATAVPTTTAKADVAFESTIYPYAITLPGAALIGPPDPATVPWDGTKRIDSGDAQTDFFLLDGPRPFFVYGAPTAMTVDAFAELSQQQVAEWHGCPAEARETFDATVDGAPARLHLFTCQGALVMKLMTVRDGFGLVVNQIASPAPADEAAARAAFLEHVAAIRWR